MFNTLNTLNTFSTPQQAVGQINSQINMGNLFKASSSNVSAMVWTISGIVLTACAGTPHVSRSTDSSVRVVDGPVKGAAVYFDLNGDGNISQEERVAQTDASGRPFYVTDENGEAQIPEGYEGVRFVAVVDNAVDIATGEVLAGEYNSLDSGLIASPLTDLLDAVEQDGGSAQEALNMIFGTDNDGAPEVTLTDVLNHENYRVMPEPAAMTEPAEVTLIETDPGFDEEMAAYEAALEAYEAVVSDMTTYMITRAAIALTEIDQDESLLGAGAQDTADQRIGILQTLFDENTANDNPDLVDAIDTREGDGRDINDGKPVAVADPYIFIDEDTSFSIADYISGEDSRGSLEDLLGFIDPSENAPDEVTSAFRGIYISTDITNGAIFFGGDALSSHQIATGDNVPSGLPSESEFYYISYSRLSALTIIPDADYFGELDVDYYVFDGVDFSNKASLIVNVRPVNDAPTLTGDTAATVNEDTGSILVGSFYFNDDQNAFNDLIFRVFVSSGIDEPPTPEFDAEGYIDSTSESIFIPGGYGTIAISLTDSGLIASLYSLDFAAVQSLNEGETRIEKITIYVSDGERISSPQSYVITIEGRNDAPTITVDMASGSVDENAAGAEISDIRFTPADVDTEITFTAGDFTIEGRDGLSNADANRLFEVVSVGNGQFTLKLKSGQALDAEAISSYKISVSVTDGAARSAFTGDITINVNNLNDNSPVITLTRSDSSINEGTRQTWGHTGYIFDVSDADGGLPVLSVEGDDRFRIGSLRYLETVPDVAFDYETESDRIIALTIIAADSGRGEGVSPATTEDIMIYVENVDEGDASFIITSSSGDVTTRAVGDVLTVKQDNPDPDGMQEGSTYSYQWFVAGGADITSETAQSYKLTQADQIVGVRVSYTDGFGAVKDITTIPGVASFLVVENPSPDDENDFDGTAGRDLIQGGGEDDIFYGGDDGDDIIIGGEGDDEISLSDGVNTIIYRFSSVNDDRWVGIDGNDELDYFKAGIDKLVFVDVDETPIDLDAFLGSTSNIEFKPRISYNSESGAGGIWGIDIIFSPEEGENDGFNIGIYFDISFKSIFLEERGPTTTDEGTKLLGLDSAGYDSTTEALRPEYVVTLLSNYLGEDGIQIITPDKLSDLGVFEIL